MILSRGRRYIFIHIPKTGGTAMALALEDRAMKDDILLGDTPKARKRRHRVKGQAAAGRLWKHSTLSDIRGLASDAEIARFFTFTLVRNPWDRAVSYYHWLQGQSFDHPAVTLAQTLSFPAFLRHPVIARGFADTPARAYMRGPDGFERASLYIRIEHLEADAQRLWDHLGFELELPRANASERDADYRRYYTPEDAGLLGRHCAEDIARFGYRF
ncbi:sulfotransferase family 2 domain-containing protein [Pseudooceanicola sp. 502str34]|uniref:sulfotransferase family 2 domain-containing protein n=1 Tax=Maritimibacter alkaliphilus TaxID=404236 RepID=UPI001C93E4E7|nr:sulfotransferase family 2 domain-containing protein [Maritimibacter alkaliphilus]MBY6088804.1 sulfotransferase family protein [Maritimibacter alkaliphilus]